jgi:hypothetical protein
MQNVLAFRLSNSLTDRGGGKRRPDIGFVNSSLWLWGRLFFGLLGLLSQPVMFFNPFLSFCSGKKRAEVARPMVRPRHFNAPIVPLLDRP